MLYFVLVSVSEEFRVNKGKQEGVCSSRLMQSDMKKVSLFGFIGFSLIKKQKLQRFKHMSNYLIIN